MFFSKLNQTQLTAILLKSKVDNNTYKEAYFNQSSNQSAKSTRQLVYKLLSNWRKTNIACRFFLRKQNYSVLLITHCTEERILN